MSFSIGDLVRFKGDPEQQGFLVEYVNNDGSVDFPDSDDGGHWSYVPARLLELAPDPVVPGDVFRGTYSGNFYYVVGIRDETVLMVCSDTPTQVTSNTSGCLNDQDLYTRIRSGKELAS